MSRSISPYNMRQARDFAKKFGTGPITVDQFDMFIIDNEMADDPKTDDPKSLAFKGFIQQRTAARKRLNNAGSYLNGESFQVRVPKAGEDDESPIPRYFVEEWNESRRGYISDIGNRVEKYTAGRYAELERMTAQVKELAKADPNNEALATTNLMVDYMRNQGIALNAKVQGLVTQYNVAANAMEDHVQKLLVAAKAPK